MLVEYDTSGVSDVRTWLYADERGSIIAGADDSGNRTFVNTYDEFGKPAAGNTGSFQYTGQLWVEEVELYHYKARAYNPEIGRFMQTDPIGYGDGLNMYNYVGSDPVNGRDPSGLLEESEAINHDIPINPNDDGCLTPDCIVVTGTRIDYGGGGALAAWSSGSGNNVIQVTILENASIGNPTTSDAGLNSRNRSELKPSDGETCWTLSQSNSSSLQAWSQLGAPATVALTWGAGYRQPRAVNPPPAIHGKGRRGAIAMFRGVGVIIELSDPVSANDPVTVRRSVTPQNDAFNPVVVELPYGGDVDINFYWTEATPRGTEIEACFSTTRQTS